MALIDSTGITPTTLSEYREILEDKFLVEFGEELALDPETPQGQIIGIMALALTEADEQLVELAQAMSLDTAAGGQLDELGTILDITRTPSRKSQVTAKLFGTVGVTVPEGAIARKPDGPEFICTEAVVLAGDTAVEVIFEARDEGAIALATSELTEIVTAIPGWTSITNESAATVGIPPETDDLYRFKYQYRTAHRSLGPVDAIRSALEEAGATYIRVEENYTNIRTKVQGFSINPHSVLIIVEDGTDSDITDAIVDSKSLGVAAMTGIVGAAVTAPLTPTGADFLYAGETFSGYTQPANGTLAAFSTALQAALATSVDNKVSTAAVDIHNGNRFAVTYPWHDEYTPFFDTSALPAAMKLRRDDVTASPGPFFRTESSDLTATVDITITNRFPANGLETLRANLIKLVKEYDIGETPWKNDFLVVAERITGVRVTNLTVTEGSTDIADISPPLNRRWNLPAGNLTVNVTR